MARDPQVTQNKLNADLVVALLADFHARLCQEQALAKRYGQPGPLDGPLVTVPRLLLEAASIVRRRGERDGVIHV